MIGRILLSPENWNPQEVEQSMAALVEENLKTGPRTASSRVTPAGEVVSGASRRMLLTSS